MIENLGFYVFCCCLSGMEMGDCRVFFKPPFGFQCLFYFIFKKFRMLVLVG